MAISSSRTIPQIRLTKAPKEFASLQGWWDADTPSVSQVSGTALKGTLLDKSGLGHHLAPISTAPIWEATTGPNGGPALQHPVATASGLRSIFAIGAPSTTLVIAKYVNGTCVVDGGTIGTNLIQGGTLGAFVFYVNGSYVAEIRPAYIDPGWHITICSSTGAGGANPSRIVTDGGISSTGFTQVGGPDGVTWGATANNTTPWGGKIRTVAIFNELMSLADQTLLGQWAAQISGSAWDIVR